LKPTGFFAFFTFSTTTEPSRPAFSQSVRSGGSIARLMMFDADTDGLALGLAGERLERLDAAQVRRAAARDDAFLDRGAGRVQRVLDAVLASPSSRPRWRAPTLITATPPASLARRSCSFSRS
jgi:hypothetical protein